MPTRTVTGLLCAGVLFAWTAIADGELPFKEPLGEISMQVAIRAALAGNPELSVYSWELRGADARVLQAGLRRNPELSLEMEDVRFSPGPERKLRTTTIGADIAAGIPAVGWNREREQGARSGFAESEITLSISQAIELGGKRAKRVTSAQKEKALAAWDYERARAAVIAGTATAFTKVLVAQERLALQDELVLIAEDVTRTIGLRVEAGKVSPLEKARADVSLAMARVDRDRAARDITIARAGLAAAWGSAKPEFSRAIGILDDLAPVPDAESLRSAIAANPDVARWPHEISMREANVALARSHRIPDATVEFGLRSTGLEARSARGFDVSSDGSFSFSNSDADSSSNREESFVLGFSIPLPIFDRNQGAVAEAEFQSSKAAAERQSVELNVTTKLFEACEIAAGARDEAMSTKDAVISSASETLEKTRIGYEQGKFGYLDVLDAQRAVFEAKNAYLDAIERYHLASIEIEQLTGHALHRWTPDAGPAVEKMNE
jgi:cobalt-zinc-cadmium efflux system outer membrane protein